MRSCPARWGSQRESVFLERAIVGERIRLAMGLPLRPVTEHSVLLSDGVEESAIAAKYYDPPLINVIKYACNACAPTHYEVTSACQGCLARHCQYACPKGAICHRSGVRRVIDQDKCIKCGKCQEACSYQAIIKFTRPCQEACGMHAIGQDEYRTGGHRLRQVRELRHVSGELPLRRHRGQGPAVPADSRHPSRAIRW